jgi:hypothetical protein
VKKIEKHKIVRDHGHQDQTLKLAGSLDAILSVQARSNDDIYIWIVVGTGKPSHVRLRTLGSAEQMPDDMLTWWKHAGSASIRDGAMDYHVFVERKFAPKD